MNQLNVGNNPGRMFSNFSEGTQADVFGLLAELNRKIDQISDKNGLPSPSNNAAPGPSGISQTSPSFLLSQTSNSRQQNTALEKQISFGKNETDASKNTGTAKEQLTSFISESKGSGRGNGSGRGEKEAD